MLCLINYLKTIKIRYLSKDVGLSKNSINTIVRYSGHTVLCDQWPMLGDHNFLEMLQYFHTMTKHPIPEGLNPW